jgi:hypothetical protein
VLSTLLGVAEERLAGVHEQWIEGALASGHQSRQPHWSEAIAVARRTFVEEIQRQLGVWATYRQIADGDGQSILREGDGVYGGRHAAQKGCRRREISPAL